MRPSPIGQDRGIFLRTYQVCKFNGLGMVGLPPSGLRKRWKRVSTKTALHKIVLLQQRLTCALRLSVRTGPSHGPKRGSIPLGRTSLRLPAIDMMTLAPMV